MSAKLLILTLSLSREKLFRYWILIVAGKTVEIEGRMIVIEVIQTMLLSEEKRS